MNLEPIKARLAAATPGRWIVTFPGDVMAEGGSSLLCALAGNSGYFPNHKANADLIAHAPEDLSALLSEVESLSESRKLYATQLQDIAELVTGKPGTVVSFRNLRELIFDLVASHERETKE
jgi:hypothetical protein